jgi:hypothetical protein
MGQRESRLGVLDGYVVTAHGLMGNAP